jgi:hypothetical protein
LWGQHHGIVQRKMGHVVEQLVHLRLLGLWPANLSLSELIPARRPKVSTACLILASKDRVVILCRLAAGVVSELTASAPNLLPYGLLKIVSKPLDDVLL